MEVFSDMEEHSKNIELYLQSGGDPKLASKHKLPTLENRAKITYLLSKVSKTDVYENSENPRQNVDIYRQSSDIVVEQPPEPSKPKFLGLIAQYPVELHPTYQNAYQIWVNVCSLKIQLNATPRHDEKEAFKIQTSILEKMQKFDGCKDALDHYNDHKRILPTITKSDFSGLSPLEIITKRNSLRSLITKRKQTIVRQEAKLPEESSTDYYKKISALNRKKEQLQKLILDEKKLNELIN